MIGTSLGRYKILEQLGAGGMGEVYLAEDTHLRRKVAVKVLPAAWASDPDRLARFVQEARAAAALNHPHIAAVFDGGSAAVDIEGTVVHYIVQEYLEGQTLREMIAEGLPPLRRSLALATEIVEALAVAHAGGILHRDVKPENVFVTRDGHSKLLDFGLAKLMAPQASEGGPARAEASTIPPLATHSPTYVGTAIGQFMGTAGYAAPEQIDGGTIDRRTDLFAFGCLLYELCSGETPFAGKSVHDTLHRIVHEEPAPLADVRLPLRLRWILEKCLQKDPAARYQDGDDLLVDLRALSERVASGTAESAAVGQVDGAPPRGVSWRTHAGWAAALVIAVATTASLLMSAGSDRPARDRPARRLAVDLDAAGELGGLPVFSPDGTKIASFSRGVLRVLDLQSGQLRELFEGESTRGGSTPMWSPDSASLAFVVPEDGLLRIRTVVASGGTPQIIYEGQRPGAAEREGGGRGLADDGRRTGAGGGRGAGGGFGAGGGAWRRDDTIVFGSSTGLIAVSVDGSGARPLYAADDRDDGTMRTAPVLLPDETLLYMEDTLGEPLRILRFAGGEPGLVRTLPAEWSGSIRGAGERFILFDRRDIDELWAIPFDYRNGSSEGAPVRVAGGASSATVSREGTLLYRLIDDTVYTDDNLVWVDRDGSVVEPVVSLISTAVYQVELSPDDARVAVALRTADDGSALRIYDVRGSATPMTLMDADFPSIAGWTDDGRGLVVSSSSGEIRGQVQILPLDGGGDPVPVGPGRSARLVANARMLLYGNTADREVKLVVLSDEGTVLSEEAFMPRLSSPVVPRVSPTAALMARTVRGTEGPALLITPFRSAGPPSWQISENASGIVWSHDGDELYFVERVGEMAMMMAASITTVPEVSIGAARPLFSLPPAAASSAYLTGVYDVAADGRFIMVRRQRQPDAPSERDRYVLIEDWERLIGGGTRER